MKARPFLFVIFGGYGDLARRKLLPALYRVTQRPEYRNGKILGVARSDRFTRETYRDFVTEALVAAGVQRARARRWAQRTHYVPLRKQTPADWERFHHEVTSLETSFGTPPIRVFYLALPPTAFAPVAEQLGTLGLHRPAERVRLVVEKPYGRDLKSAQELTRRLHQVFHESQIYRIDHYLGKETVQNLLNLRFANEIFHALWNHQHIQNVEITVAEKVGIGTRAKYYDQAGVLRDMVQNHLTQLFTLVAMEPPVHLQADEIRNEKVRVLRAARLDRSGRKPPLVLGQYDRGTVEGQPVPAYREEPGIPANSTTPTFAALRLRVENDRWNDVEFYLRTGKRLPIRASVIVIQFQKPVPARRYRLPVEPNHLVVRIQPNEGFQLWIGVKQPGKVRQIRRVNLHLAYQEFARGPLPDAYETLLLDILEGDQTLFVRADEVEASWRLYDTLLQQEPLYQVVAETETPPPQGVPVYRYAAGTWGPRAARRVLHRNKDNWWLEAQHEG